MKRVFLVLAFLAAGCGDAATDATTTSSASVAPSAATTSIPSAVEGLNPWPPFGATSISFGDTDMPVLVADTPEQRSQGLMGVTDMADFVGMLFVFEDEVTSGFWMKDTLIPLTVIYLDAEGTEVSRAEMEPCVDGNACPSHPPDGQYLYALEMPTGSEVLPESPAEAKISLPS